MLFADISGFTAMSETLDPEDVVDVMNRCFEVIERVIVGHGGHVDKYIGECVMALFGVPTAIEHAPRQAVSAASAIRMALDRFTQEQRLPTRLEIHAGLNSGLVIAGGIGGEVRRDFTVMGDTVNVASRLKPAPPGQIYVGAETYYCTKDNFEYRPLKLLALRGRKRRPKSCRSSPRWWASGSAVPMPNASKASEARHWKSWSRKPYAISSGASPRGRIDPLSG